MSMYLIFIYGENTANFKIFIDIYKISNVLYLQ